MIMGKPDARQYHLLQAPDAHHPRITFWPHGYQPGLLNVEGRIAPEVRAELARRGHRINEWGPWNAAACSVCAIVVDPETDTRIGGADPRRECYALGYKRRLRWD